VTYVIRHMSASDQPLPAATQFWVCSSAGLVTLTDNKSISAAGPTRQAPGRIKVHEWSAWNYGSPGDCTWGVLLFVGLCFLRAVCLDALTGFFSDS
jgi:hypothetical protein